jgi:diguanylate cyclase (GGDEF)-like protein
VTPESLPANASDSVAALECACAGVDRVGDIAALRTLGENALASIPATGDKQLEARARAWLAHAHLYRGALTKSLAEAALAESLAYCVDDWLVAARMHAIVGNCEFMLAQYGAAFTTLEAGIALAHARGFRVTEAAMRGTLGSVLAAMGEFDEGEAAFVESLAGLTAPEETHRRQRILGNFAGLMRRRGEHARANGDNALAARSFAEAIRIAETVLATARATRDPIQLPYSLGMLGALHRDVGELENAADCLRESLALGEEGANTRLVALGALDLARVLHDQGRTPEALAMLVRARDAAQSGQMTKQLAEAWREEAGLQEASGDFRAALDALRRFHEVEFDRLAKERAREEQSRGALTEIRQLRRETAELRGKTAAAELQARRDSLTGLANRIGFDIEALPLLERVNAVRAPVAMAWLDLDRFKSINDRFGHAVGDEVLAGVGRLLQLHVRGGDLAARLGGDEFVLLLPGADRRAALALIERLREGIAAHPWEALAPGLRVTFSIGIAERMAGESVADLGRRADEALYAAKRAGRDRVES